MKIAFDYHGVLEKYPKRFKNLLINIDCKRVILSGPSFDQIYEEITKMGYYLYTHYDKIISVVDWIKKSGVEMSQHENGSWYCDNDETWWGSKARICEENNIDMLFDDSVQYKQHIINNKPLFFLVE